MRKTFLLCAWTALLFSLLNYQHFSASAATNETCPKLFNTNSYSTNEPANLYPLLGVWEFSYTIEDEAYIQTYTLDSIAESKNYEGQFIVEGRDKNNEYVVATYSDNEKVFSLLDKNEYEPFDHLYTFIISDGKATGSYQRVKPHTLDTISAVPFSGVKTENLSPPPPDGTTITCPASALLKNDSESLNLLRQFREKVLIKTMPGRAIIYLYYRYAHILSTTLENNPNLKEHCKNTLSTLVKIIKDSNIISAADRTVDQ